MTRAGEAAADLRDSGGIQNLPVILRENVLGAWEAEGSTVTFCGNRGAATTAGAGDTQKKLNH